MTISISTAEEPDWNALLLTIEKRLMYRWNAQKCRGTSIDDAKSSVVRTLLRRMEESQISCEDPSFNDLLWKCIFKKLNFAIDRNKSSRGKTTNFTDIENGVFDFAALLPDHFTATNSLSVVPRHDLTAMREHSEEDWRQYCADVFSEWIDSEIGKMESTLREVAELWARGENQETIASELGLTLHKVKQSKKQIRCIFQQALGVDI